MIDCDIKYIRTIRKLCLSFNLMKSITDKFIIFNGKDSINKNFISLIQTGIFKDSLTPCSNKHLCTYLISKKNLILLFVLIQDTL